MVPDTPLPSSPLLPAAGGAGPGAVGAGVTGANVGRVVGVSDGEAVDAVGANVTAHASGVIHMMMRVGSAP